MRRDERPPPTAPVIHRTIAVALIRNRRGEILLCKMPEDRGVYPDQWGLPGGGIEEGETMEEALRREVREEVGLEISAIEPLSFRDATEDKTYAGGTKRRVYMIYLLFRCRAAAEAVTLNEEFERHAWVKPEDLGRYDLNPATREMLAVDGAAG